MLLQDISGTGRSLFSKPSNHLIHHRKPPFEQIPPSTSTQQSVLVPTPPHVLPGSPKRYASYAGSLDSKWDIENFWMYYFTKHEKQIQNKNGLEYFDYSYSCHLLESHATFWNRTRWILERFSTWKTRCKNSILFWCKATFYNKTPNQQISALPIVSKVFTFPICVRMACSYPRPIGRAALENEWNLTLAGFDADDVCSRNDY